MLVKLFFMTFSVFVHPTFEMVERPPIQQSCRASYYGEGNWHGSHTAWGEKFDPQAMTAAHRKLPQNTVVLVERANKDKAAWVRINDRGPYVIKRGEKSIAKDEHYEIKEGEEHWRNCIDLTIKAAEKLDIKEDGMKTVHIRYWRTPHGIYSREGGRRYESEVYTGRVGVFR